MKQVTLFTFLLTLFTSFSLHAQLYQGSVSKAAGGAGRASIEPLDVIVLNPSTLVHLRGRHVTTSFQKDAFVIGLTDNTKESRFPGGAAYFQTNSQIGNDTLKTKDFHASLSEFATDSVTVGASVHYYENIFQEQKYTQVNGHLSSTWTPTPQLGLGAVLYDIGPVKQDAPQIFRLEPTAAVGINFLYSQFFRMRFDLKSAPGLVMNRLTYAGGVESYFADWAIFRVGAARDDFMSETWYSAGLGFLGPRFYLNYAFQRTFARAETVPDRNFHSIDFGIPF